MTRLGHLAIRVGGDELLIVTGRSYGSKMGQEEGKDDLLLALLQLVSSARERKAEFKNRESVQATTQLEIVQTGRR